MTTNLLSVIEQLTKAAIYFKEVDPSVRSHCTWNGTTESEAAAAIEAGTQAQGDDSDDVTISVDYFEKLECCRRLLEIIATGDSEEPRKDAEDELVAHGFWNPVHPQAIEPAPKTGYNT